MALPPLPLYQGLRYHVFFVHHPDQSDWVLDVMERLEVPTNGIQCTSLEHVLATNRNCFLHQVRYIVL
jgi:hypothetical protein